MFGGGGVGGAVFGAAPEILWEQPSHAPATAAPPTSDSTNVRRGIWEDDVITGPGASAWRALHRVSMRNPDASEKPDRATRVRVDRASPGGTVGQPAP